MKRTIPVLFTAVWLLTLLMPVAEAQVKQSRDAAASTPLSKMPRVVREEVERLISDDPGKRATAAASLGEMGSVALPAIPWLIAVVTDDRRVVSITEGDTFVGCIAALAIAKIDMKWHISLVQVVSDAKAVSSQREGAARALAHLNDVEAIEPLIRAYKGLAESLPERPKREEHLTLSYFGRALERFADPRVVDAFLDVAAMPVRHPDDKSNRALSSFRHIVESGSGMDYSAKEETFADVEKARLWWSKNRGIRLGSQYVSTCR